MSPHVYLTKSQSELVTNFSTSSAKKAVQEEPGSLKRKSSWNSTNKERQLEGAKKAETLHSR